MPTRAKKKTTLKRPKVSQPVVKSVRFKPSVMVNIALKDFAYILDVGSISEKVVRVTGVAKDFTEYMATNVRRKNLVEFIRDRYDGVDPKKVARDYERFVQYLKKNDFLAVD